MKTAHSEETWRPGFAKRASNFDQVCEIARQWRWRPGETVPRISAAVLKGTPMLTATQRMTLLLYVEHLNQERLERGVACVWPSTALIADYLGCGDSTARGNRAALEAAGYIVRDYNRANRPAGVEAYDLAPLVARLDEMEAVDQAVRDAAEARRQAYLEPLVFAQKDSAQAPISRRLEQSQKNFSSSVTRSNPHSNNPNAKDNPTNSANSSPARALGFGHEKTASEGGAEMVRQELKAALTVCPRLAAVVGDRILINPDSVSLEDIARITTAAEGWLPDIERNNALSVMWGWKKHGVRVIAMLAIALEDPAVQNPCKYFGWMVTQSAQNAPDLRLNLLRILRGKGGSLPLPTVQAPPPSLLQAPGTDDRTWRAIDQELRKIVREGAYGSWFTRVGFHGIKDGLMTLSTPSQLAADRIKRDFQEDIYRAAETAGVFVERLIIMLRR